VTLAGRKTKEEGAMFKIVVVVLSTFILETSVQATDKIRIGYPSPSVGHISLPLAQKKGFLKEQNIDAEIIRIPSPASLAALVNGDIDYYSAVAPVVGAAIRGLPLKVVACYVTGSQETLIARPGIKSVKDLKGKTIAVSAPGAASTAIPLIILRHFGLDPQKDVKLLHLAGVDSRLIAMKQGLADAYSLGPPFDYLAKKDGFVVLARAYELFSYPNVGLTANTKKIREKPDEIKRVIKAGLKASRYIQQNREGTIQFLTEWQKVNNELATATYESVVKSFSEDGNIPVDGLRLIIEEGKKSAKINGEISFNDVADSTILKAAQKELGIKGE
jgi:NitT/TauT family transport system substrate-binding protein